MKIQIKNRFDISVIVEPEAATIALAVRAAIEAKADLSGADLRGAGLTLKGLSKQAEQPTT